MSAGRRFEQGASWALRGLALSIALLVNAPLFYLLWRIGGAGPERLGELLSRPSLLPLLGRTLALAASAAVLAVSVALPLAWLVRRSDVRGARVWALLGALPLVVPSYVAALSAVSLLGPRGVAARLIEPFGGGSLPGELVYGYSGAVLVLGLFTYPYVYLLLLAQMERLDPALEESARSLGASPLQVFFRVVLPQLRPALLGGGLLVALYAASDFGAVSLLRYDTFTLAVYNAYRGLFDRTAAATLAGVLAAFTLALVALDAWLQRRARTARPPAARRVVTRQVLGRWQWPALVFAATVSLAPMLLVTVALLRFAAPLLRGDDRVLRTLGRTVAAGGDSLAVSLPAAVVTVILALPLVVWALRGGSRLARLAERASYTGHALPGLVVALSLVFLSIRLVPALYQTYPLLIAGYVILFLPEAARAIRASLSAVSPRYEEVARTLGRSRLGALFGVTFPLLRPGLLAGGALVFLTCMKELPATLILAPIGTETLAVRVWQAAEEGFYAEAALPALLLVLLTAPVVYAFVIAPVVFPRRRTLAAAPEPGSWPESTAAPATAQRP
jgi:iron(III) transport system permease protein